MPLDIPVFLKNALLEAGRDRIQGGNSIIYCTTCPCLSCAKKIVQSGVKEVIYLQDYKTDKATFRLFNEAGIKIRKYHPMPTCAYMSRRNYSSDEGVECILEEVQDMTV